MANRKTEERARPTAQPGKVSERLKRSPVEESGLSVDPEDLGVQFLRDATEQGNFESSMDADASELSIVEGAPSDDPLTEPAFEPDRSVWESTVHVSMESGGVDEMREETAPAGSGSDESPSESAREVDVTDPAIREASLFDREADELGEVAPSSPRTDDNRRRRMRGPQNVSR